MELDKLEMAIQPAPASFGNEDVTQLHDHLPESVQVTQGLGPAQESATISWSAENRFDVDWHKYEPPSALRKAPNVTSIILLDILSQSIANVKKRIADEDLAKQVEAERGRVAEEEAANNGMLPEPYLPIVIPAERPLEPDMSSVNDFYSGAGVAPNPGDNVALAPFMRDRGHRRNALRRFFHRVPGSGEGSSAGGTREAIWQKVEALLSRVDIASRDSTTPEVLMSLRKSGVLADAEPSKPDFEVQECVSCLDDVSIADAVRLPCHSYCRDCFVRLVNTALQLEAQWPPKCCLNPIPFRLVLKNIPDDQKRTFQERSLEWQLPISERVYCGQPDCGVWIRPNQIMRDRRQGRCERGHFTCTICRGPSHELDECPEDYGMKLTNVLAEEEGWQRCYNCHAIVEHRSACEHMTCRCGCQFCYICGLPWKTCRCTADQLTELKEAAARRRQQRRLEEQVEAELLRAILAEIEELERQEAARAELERLQEARLEEKRRQRRIDERIRFEGVRRGEIIAKFRELRIHLSNLDELQHVMMGAQQEDRVASLLAEADSRKKKLAERHEAERHQFQQEMSARINLVEKRFAKEYHARVALERKVEEEHLERLRRFWHGRPRADEGTNRGMLPLQRRMDRGHKAWQTWRDEQMGLYEARLAEEQMRKEEIMYGQVGRAKDVREREELELTRRVVAEEKWFEEVVLERERLLGEREVQEVEGDADSLFTGEEQQRVM